MSTASEISQSTDPCTYATRAQLDRARARSEQLPWAKAIVRKLLADCDTQLSSPVRIPEKAGQWSHHYVCKKCGTRLDHNGKGQHLCPRCGIEYKGWPYDEVIAARDHTNNIEAIRDMGLAYALTSNTMYAARARELLLEYANRYTSFPIHDYKGGTMQKGARIFAQTLDESIRAIAIAWGYDLVRGSGIMSAQDRTHIENDLLRPLAATIDRNRMGISNWQSWHDAALAGIGYLLRDTKLIDTAVAGADGARFQLQNSVLRDGFWYEGSASYHFYALEALSWTARANATNGGDLYMDARLLSMFAAPLDYAFPDGVFPAVNDSDAERLGGQHEQYEIGFAWYGDARMGAVAADGKRNSIGAVVWGADNLPRQEAKQAGSRDFPGLGAVMVRQGAGTNEIVAHFDYGPHGGAHGHFDKLALILFMNGHVVAPDPARVAYGSPFQSSWYKTTLAHNTLVVDGKSQGASAATLDFFKSQDGIAVAGASTDTAYPGVSISRRIGITKRYLLDVVTVQNTSGSKEHTFDLAWHFYGSAKTGHHAEPASAPLGKSAGYQHLENVRLIEKRSEWTIDYVHGGSEIRQTTIADRVYGNMQMFTAEGMADNPPIKCPMTIARVRGQAACFITLIQPKSADGECRIERRNPRPDFFIDIGVATPDGQDDWYMGQTGRTALNYSGSAGKLQISE